MEKHKIEVPDVAGFARPRTRKGFLKSLALAGAGAAATSAIFASKANAQDYSDVGAGDLEIANFALTLEYLEAEFYANALNAGVVGATALPTVQALADHEAQHVTAITDLITAAGGTPVAKPTFTFPADAFSSEASILTLAGTFEPVGVGAYLGAAPLITAPAVLAAAGSIAGVEGEHVVAVNFLNGVVPPANTAFPAALSMDEVLAAVAPFLGMGAMPDTGGVPQ